MSSVRRQFYFLHIPKTAGTSLRNIIEAQFPPDRINDEYNSMTRMIRKPAEEFNRYHLIRGHFTYNLVDRFPVFPRVLTMLRHPVERTISHLLHVKSNPKFWLHRFVPLATAPLDQVLEHEAMHKFVSNHQLRLLGYDFDLEHPHDPKMLHSPHEVDERLFEVACERLQRCEFVGISERFADSIDLMCRQFGWPPVESVPQLNVRESPPEVRAKEVSERTVERIRELNAWEMKLYEFACKLYEERRTAVSG